MADDRLSRTDAAFWHLESPAAPMHLGALVCFEHPDPAAAEPGDALPHVPPTPQAAARLLCERAARVPLLRQKVSAGRHPAAGLRWVPDPAFDARRHVHLHPPDDDHSLERLAAHLMAAPLNPTLPPWEVHLLPRPRAVGAPGTADGFALLFKVHHAAVDGLRAVELGARLLDQYQPRHADPADAAPPSARPRPPAPGS
ncbi:wax ester/triacylglycerol synthase domain-containing protein, partial [Streptacidiphilus anmyonensis]|uniref:wax ester/triacylglycerol synthase domain-containing protein n=1 Tax=Streptacidiphilus anmyonensis TaxID=405782 RepID=UPI00272B8B68